MTSPAAPLPAAGPGRSLRWVVFLVGAVQFVNILDFVMVMPLGPDFARDLGIPVSDVGLVGGSYTAAAGLSGVLGSFFLERFDRRSALCVAMLGLVLGTLSGGFAQGLPSLIAARVLAGAFGGPATSLALSIIADVVPPERRGRAMGAVMGAFAVAMVMGVPAGLYLAQWGGWRLPFFALASLGLAVTLAVAVALPPLRGHLATLRSGHGTGLRSLFGRGDVWLSYAMTATAMGAGFILIPNISAYVQENLGYPRERLGELYLYGGLASFLTTRVAGTLVDRLGSLRVCVGGSVLLLGFVYTGFYANLAAVSAPVVFVGFMTAMGLRNVAYNTLTSKVPGPGERARFMSFQSAVQHFASASGAVGSARLLATGADGKLVGMPRVALLSMLLTVLLLPLMWAVERQVRRAAARSAALPAPAG